MRLSVLISVYDGDDPDDVRRSLESIYNQTLQPNEVVIVRDGEISESLSSIINNWVVNNPITTKYVRLESNRGLGEALSIGLEHCAYDLVARMDSDDIAVDNRFKKQLCYLRNNSNVAVVGGYMKEIVTDSGLSHVRKVPLSHEQIRSTARFRCPLNHPTVIFRKDAVEAVGGYRDLRSMQDYDLWIRLLNEGYTITNLPEVLVETEADDLYDRRGGLEYAKLEYQLQKDFLEMGFTSYPVFAFNLMTRIPIRLLPNHVRKKIYTSLLRD